MRSRGHPETMKRQGGTAVKSDDVCSRTAHTQIDDYAVSAGD
jgi:hypothetical protein